MAGPLLNSIARDGQGEMQMATWHADDGNSEETIEASSGREAARKYVDGGDWDEITSTIWVHVRVWQIDDDGDEINEAWHKIAVDPESPRCVDGEHDWQQPHAVVGGFVENPGVMATAGGIVSTECCTKCGCGRVTDTYAQDPQDGVCGLTSVKYVPGMYAESLCELEGNDGSI